MNGTHPPQPPAAPHGPAAPAPPPRSGSTGCWLGGCGFGCLAAIVVCLAVAVGGYFFLKKKLDETIAEFTSPQPVLIEPPALSPAEVEDAISRFDHFRTEVGADRDPGVLVLTSDDVNALLHHHPDLRAAAGVADVTIEDGRIRSRVSLNLEELDIPVGFLAGMLRGRYFNGDAVLTGSLQDGRPQLYVEELEVGGVPLPREAMAGIASHNLLEGLSERREFAEAVERLESVRIEGDRIRVVPKGPR